MKTLLSILPQAFNYLSSVLALLDDPKGSLEFFKQPWSQIGNTIVSKIVEQWTWRIPLSIISAILAWVYRAHLRRLLHYLFPNLVGADGPKQTDEDKAAETVERKYLNWLKDYLPPPLPDPEKTPIPIPANKSLRPQLTRYNAAEWSNPILREIGLSDRHEFGKGSAIRDLIRELKKKNRTATIVLGDPGSGKSVCLRQLAVDLCTQQLRRKGRRPQTLPIYVEMKAYDRWDEQLGNPTELLEFLKTSLTSHESQRNDPEGHPAKYVGQHLSDLLSAGRATLLLDALDEMPQQSYRQRTDILEEFVNYWKKQAPGNRFVLSCRWLDYNEAFSVDEIVIEPFDDSRIKKYLETFLTDPRSADALFKTIEKNETLREAVSNPFVLHALTEVKNRSKNDIPTSRTKLIKAYVDILLQEIEAGKREDLKKFEGGLPTLGEFLSELAFTLQQTGTSAHPQSLRQLWAKYPDWQEMISIARQGSILREEPKHVSHTNAFSGRIEFKHHRLQEYFAAEALARRYNDGEVIDDYLKDVWWQEVVLFAIASVKDTHSLIEHMLSLREDTENWIEKVLVQARNPFAENKTQVDETVTT